MFRATFHAIFLPIRPPEGLLLLVRFLRLLAFSLEMPLLQEGQVHSLRDSDTYHRRIRPREGMGDGSDELRGSIGWASNRVAKADIWESVEKAVSNALTCFVQEAVDLVQPSSLEGDLVVARSCGGVEAVKVDVKKVGLGIGKEFDALSPLQMGEVFEETEEFKRHGEVHGAVLTIVGVDDPCVAAHGASGGAVFAMDGPIRPLALGTLYSINFVSHPYSYVWISDLRNRSGPYNGHTQGSC
jgi:hypothetical protein